MEIADLQTLSQICYDSTEEELLSVYKQMNGYDFFEKDFKTLRIQELEEYYHILKKYEKFLNVFKEVFDIEIDSFLSEKEFKELLINLKSKQRIEENKSNINISNAEEENKSNINISNPEEENKSNINISTPEEENKSNIDTPKSQEKKEIDPSIPFYKLTFVSIQMLPWHDERRQQFKKSIYYLDRHIPPNFESKLTLETVTIEKLVKEIMEEAGKTR